MARMRAIGVGIGEKKARIFELEQPKISKPKQVLLKMVSVGICGSDRDIIENSLVDPPKGENKMILGHEGLGKVLETGKKSKFKKGDYVTMIPRHGCNICKPCKTRRADFCETGQYIGAGQHKLHGYNSEFYVDEEEYLVKVKKKIAEVGVLIEPFSIVEKAMEHIEQTQARIPGYDLKKQTAIVFGMGSVGIAAIAILAAKGVRTHVLGRRPETDRKVKLVKKFGANYINIKEKPKLGTIGNSQFVDLSQIAKETGGADIIIEATGAIQLVVDLIDLMKKNAVYVFLGIPKGSEELCFNIRGMINKIVRQNLVITGSVNSQRIHFEMALKNIEAVQKKFPGLLNEMITHRYRLEQYSEAFGKEPDDLIKAIIEFEKVQ